VPIDNTEKRMANVKKYADQVCSMWQSQKYNYSIAYFEHITEFDVL